MRIKSISLMVVVLAACGQAVDVDDIGSTDEYRAWDQFVVTGHAAAHSDSYRIIYANDVARSWPGAGSYPVGTVVIKEIYKVDSDGEQGDLSYVAIARRMDEAPKGVELDDGWLYTISGNALPAKEKHAPYCWSACHISAPYDGLYHDLGE